MTTGMLLLLCAAVLAVAFLYSSVGHAGASGYIAVMALFGLSSEVIRPSALVLNILVASIASWHFWRAGHFSWDLFWPFGLPSIPFAFLGGYLNLPTHVFKILVGLVLLLSAFRFLIESKPGDQDTAPPSRPVAFGTGAGIGLLSGLTGTGGGIFLTPLMIIRRWSGTKSAAAISALFILVNSASGLAGNLSSTKELPPFVWPLAAAVIVGGATGSYLGSRQFSNPLIRRLLAVVLTIAGCKLILT